MRDSHAPVVADLRDRGLHVVNGFLPAADCEELRREVERLLASHPRFRRTGRAHADQRLFGADRVSATIAAIFNDPFIRGCIDAYEGVPSDGVAMVNRVVAKPGNLGSGQGWHRDNVIRTQTKAIVYLSDVDVNRGPFQYIARSNRPANIPTDNAVIGAGPQRARFTEDEVAGISSGRADAQRVTVIGAAGTLIIADTRGIHRGAPLRRGVRLACTTYLWSDPAHIPPSMSEVFLPAPVVGRGRGEVPQRGTT